MAAAIPRNTTSIYATVDPPSPQGFINMLVTSFKPLYQLLIVTCICSAMLVPIFVLLWFSSDRKARRKPIFIANVASIVIGLTLAATGISLFLSELLNPLAAPNIRLFLTYNILLSFSPLLVESILLIRLWTVYPFRTTPLTTFLAIFIPIALLKLARIVNLIIYVVKVSNDLASQQQTVFWFLDVCRTWFSNSTVEWFLQVADNTSASVLFLVKLNEVRAFRSRTRGWSSTLEALFWIAVSNFVIPVMLSIAQLAVLWASKDIFIVAPIMIVNIYVEIIGVLLATVWTVGSRWREETCSRSVPALTTVTVGMDELTAGSYESINISAKPRTIGI